jgi:protein tyrosine phosphatase (PTP) superfamily phosphohydrolase (DUF442 family)
MVSRALLSAGVLLVCGGFCGCVYLSRHTLEGACATALDSPVRNFCVVTPEVLWRGERPTTADAQWLLEHGVQSILSLQLPDQRAFEAAAPSAERAYSVAYFQIKGFDPLQMLSRARVDRQVALFLAVLREAPKPLYLHCRAGVDRVGVLIAAYRVLIEGASREQAIDEMARFHSPWLSLEIRYVRGLDEARQAAILHNAQAWAPRLRPTAGIECVRGNCRFSRKDGDVNSQIEQSIPAG